VYDPKSEAHEFVGSDRREAIEKACRYFDLPEDELRIGELAAGEVYGLGARSVVVAVPRSAPAPRPPEERGGGGRDREPREGRGRGRDRDRGDRGERRDRGRGRRAERPERAEREETPEPVRAPEPSGPSKATATTELSEVGEFVAGLIERMEIGPFEIGEAEEDDLQVVQVRGEAPLQLTSGDGRAVDAIQLLANQAAMRVSDEAPRVVVDVEGDREQRDSYLEDLAQRAARRALKVGRSVALDPMNAKDRRAVHVALRDARDVATMSTGEGRYRQVVVVPKGAPEYEEAARLAEEAARSEG